MATLLSFGCVVAVTVMLSKIDNKPLGSWTLLIQPKSFVSVLATVINTTMMVAAASCLSQLKRCHFRWRSRRVADIELFEMASKGP